MPTAAALLAQRAHAPGLFLVYESGALGVRPEILPLSVADSVLATSARLMVSVPEVFNYWLQPGRIDVGVLGGAQIDRFANINSTSIGPYDGPRIRLPGAGGAPEIAGACGETIVILRLAEELREGEPLLQQYIPMPPEAIAQVKPFWRRSVRLELRCVTRPASLTLNRSFDKAALEWLAANEVDVVITDLGVYDPDPATCELVLTHLQPGATVAAARAATGWELAVADTIGTVDPPTATEIATLRALMATRSQRDSRAPHRVG